ncbi:HEAT repeat domain-containing protein [Humisphaera borealis]|uniref:HEAT repeat domain-containing protein n=1 Tax=Humisphaera borealis TaxID=2807512 RepID=A0A7M2WXL5_9BACT|nr:HEAT repeat domain-containing protein [Humisphaera borealis]QOV89541.1 HEAT repeat domain-containing protein [Humisphaera borealis]
MSTTTAMRSDPAAMRAERQGMMSCLADFQAADPGVRGQAVRAAAMLSVGSADSTDPMLLKALLACLHDPAAEVRMAAADAFNSPEGPPIAALPPLRELLHDDEPCVRRAAAGALGASSGSPDVVRDLANVLQDSDADVRCTVLDVLRQRGGDAEFCLPQVRTLIHDPDDGVRVSAIEMLKDFGGAGIGADEAAALMKDASALVRRAVAGLMGQVAQFSEVPMAAWQNALTDEDPAVRLAAAAAARATPAVAPLLAAELSAAMRDESPLVRDAARAAFSGAIGESRPWVSYLLQIHLALEAVGDTASERALLLVEGPVESVSLYFCEILDHPNPVVVWNAAIGLSAVGPAAVIAAPRLLPLLGRSRTMFRVCGVCGFLSMGPAALPWLDALVRRLADGDPLVRQLSAMAIGGIGTAADAAIPALRSALNDPRETVRTAAATALSAVTVAANQSPP